MSATLSLSTGQTASSNQAATRKPSGLRTVAGGKVKLHPFLCMCSSGPATMRKASSKSPQVRAMGPATDKSCPKEGSNLVGCGFGSGSTSGWLLLGARPWPGTRPYVGLCPQTPQKCAGFRMEPPMSEPSSSAESPAAIAAAEPPELPPGVLDRSHGLLVMPYISLYVWKSDAAIGKLVLPMMTAPASKSRCTIGALLLATKSLSSGTAHVVRVPSSQ
mmetsp:Transcript_109004/g.243434  ORF Transcript_109004/g.243434 Transcript_109004/m.243434 type:complete len:218 (+) Transcript_109004:595-1248(+)